jgi:hypothetical protein
MTPEISSGSTRRDIAVGGHGARRMLETTRALHEAIVVDAVSTPTPD